MLQSRFSICVMIRFFLILFGLVVSQYALAHAQWTPGSETTPPRTIDRELTKAAPCGVDLASSTDPLARNEFMEGQTIIAEWQETTNHTSHFRIAFSPLADPQNISDFDNYIIADNIPDTTPNSNNNSPGQYSMSITLPPVECAECTLQLTQDMGSSDYYSCSNITLTQDTTLPDPVPSATATAGTDEVDLSWVNPSTEFHRIVILSSVNPVTDSPDNNVDYAVGDMIGASEVVYFGQGTSHKAELLSGGTKYYFKLFAQNLVQNYAAGLEVSATPVVSTNTGGNNNNTGGENDNNNTTDDSTDNTQGSCSIGNSGSDLILFLLLVAASFRITRLKRSQSH